MEDRRWKIANRKIAILNSQSSILYPPSSILYPRSSILGDQGLLKRIPSERRTWFCLPLSFGTASPRNV